MQNDIYGISFIKSKKCKMKSIAYGYINIVKKNSMEIISSKFLFGLPGEGEKGMGSGRYLIGALTMCVILFIFFNLSLLWQSVKI